MTARIEQETIIRWDEEADTADIWTASAKTRRKLARLGIEPRAVSTREGEDGGAQYVVPLSMLRWSVRGKRKVSEAQRKAAAERFAKARARK